MVTTLILSLALMASLMLYLLKAFDMICFDWLLLTKSRFF